MATGGRRRPLAGAIDWFGPAIALAVALAAGTRAEAAEVLRFEVRRDGAPIGHHQVTVTGDDSGRTVAVEIVLEVRIAWITVYRYRHDNLERWLDGRLVALDSRTDDNGTRHRVTVRPTADGTALRIDGSAGVIAAAPDVATTTYWDRRVFDADRVRLIDTQTGAVRAVTVEQRSRADREVLGRTVAADRLRLGGALDSLLWYGPTDQWIGMHFTFDRSDITYHRAIPPTG